MPKAITVRLATVVVVVCLITLMSTFTFAPKTAHATATGCTRWGAVYIPVVHVTIPIGQYCFTVNGQGTTVNYTLSSFNTPWIINPTEVVHFYDNSGREYATFHTYSHSGYAYGFNMWYSSIHGTAQGGRICGELLASGTHVTTACESIF